jgi:lysylphosphatidylglycerol synthetase-like protein (DUF2156 family)
MIQGILSLYNNGNLLDSLDVYNTYLRLGALSGIFNNFTDLLMIMTLAEMGNGFLFCLTQTTTGVQKAMRYTAVTTCVILAMLAIAQFGVSNARYSQWVNLGYGDDLYPASQKMSSAFSYLVFFCALGLLVFAAIVYRKAKRNHVLKNVSRAQCPILESCSNFSSTLLENLY